MQKGDTESKSPKLVLADRGKSIEVFEIGEVVHFVAKTNEMIAAYAYINTAIGNIAAAQYAGSGM